MLNRGRRLSFGVKAFADVMSASQYLGPQEGGFGDRDLGGPDWTT